jgi:hypothetical protein
MPMSTSVPDLLFPRMEIVISVIPVIWTMISFNVTAFTVPMIEMVMVIEVIGPP